MHPQVSLRRPAGRASGCAAPSWLLVLSLVAAAEATDSPPVVSLSPKGAANFEVVLGSAPAPDQAVFTLCNSSRESLHWEAAGDAPWLGVSPAQGSLAPCQQAHVSVRLLDVTQLSAGRYAASVVFRGVAGRAWSRVREVGLTIRLGTPELAVEPPFTRGSSNTVSWSWIPGANEYEVQAATRADFSDALSSGWFRGTNYTFTELQDGVRYFYRVHCRSNLTRWSQTLASQFAQNENRRVSTATRPGDLVLAGNTNRLWFEDFEAPGSSWTNTLFSQTCLFWPAVLDRGPQGDDTLAPDTDPPLPINQGGDYEGRLRDTPHAYAYALLQNVPDGGPSNVTVDAYLCLATRETFPPGVAGGIVLRATPQSGCGGVDCYAAILTTFSDFSHRWLSIRRVTPGRIHWLASGTFRTAALEENYHLRFTANGALLRAELWRVSATNGIIVERPVLLSNGTNALQAQDDTLSQGAVGLTGKADGFNSSVFFDDVSIRARDGPPHHVASGSSTALVAPPNWFERWGPLRFVATASAPVTRLTVDVLAANGALLAADVASGTDLSTIPAVAQRRRLRLRANLSTTDPKQTPALAEWQVQFHLPEANPTQSDWSPVVESTQDNLPPVLSITHPAEDFLIVTNETLTLIGTALDSGSGVRRVSGIATEAETTNGFTNWTLTVRLSQPGTNSLVVAARDNASPANVALVWRRVVYEPLAGLGNWPQPAIAATSSPPDGAPGSASEMDLTPAIRLENGRGAVVLLWPATARPYVLQQATTLWPPDWRDVPGVTCSPAILPLDGQARFFRLVQK